MLRSTETNFNRGPTDENRDRLQVFTMRYYALSTPVGGARWGQSVAFQVDNES
jgi:hypothetical protein